MRDQFNLTKYLKRNRLLREEDYDISFKFKIDKGRLGPGVISHDIVTIDVFNTPDRENVQFVPYHLIFGQDSLAIFDAFDTDEVAGLTRQECIKHIEGLKAQGKDETEDAYIAGLSNWAGNTPFQFFNVTRLNRPGYATRVLTHESLHVARMLITTMDNEYVRTNVGKPDWWKDPKSAFANMQDENEELFAESLERISSIAFDRWEKAKSQIKKTP